MTNDLDSQIRIYANYLDEVDPVDAPPSYIHLADAAEPSRRGRWLAAAAAIVAIGGIGVALSLAGGDGGTPSVASTPTTPTTAQRQLTDEVIDGEPALARPVGGPVEFTISTPDGDLHGTMQRSTGDFGDGSGFCAGVSGGGGGCYGGSNGTYRERPHLMGSGSEGLIGTEIPLIALWLVPDGVDELLITWDDGSSTLLPVAWPIDGLPGVTATVVPRGVLGGTATGAGVDVPFEFGQQPVVMEGPNGPYMGFEASD